MIPEEELKRCKMVSRLVVSDMIKRLAWEDYDSLMYQIFCMHFKSLPEKAYDDAERKSYNISFWPVFGKQTVVARIVNTWSEKDVLEFKRKYDEIEFACSYKLFYVYLSADESLEQFMGEASAIWPQIEVLQSFDIAKHVIDYNLDIGLAEKINSVVLVNLA